MEVAAVVCVDVQADLAPDLYALMSSVYLEDKHLFYLQVQTVLYAKLLFDDTKHILQEK